MMPILFNKPQLVKELRPLLLPWLVAVGAGALIALKPLLDGAGWEALLTGLVAYGFLGGLALVATLSFGHELQDRTLGLLLTQPLSRSRLWQQKTFLITAAVLAAALVEFLALSIVSGWYSQEDLWQTIRVTFRSEEFFMAGFFLLATVCSCGFWTLFARSVIGGLVFTVAAQFITGVAVALLWGEFRGYDEPFQDPMTFVLICAAGILYSGVFLWAGWRKFTLLEVRTGHIGEGGAAGATGTSDSVWARLLISRPNGRVMNFLKKELGLQKVVAQLSIVCAACWVAVLLLQWLRPTQRLDFLYGAIICIYAPLASLLAGCISLGEEKALGLTTSQRALPFAPSLQWLLKLCTGATSAVVLGLGVPVILLLATNGLGLIHDSELLNPEAGAVLGCISGFIFVLGFWAIGLAPNTLRAALISIAGSIILPALTFIGIYLAGVVLGIGGAGPQENQVALVLRHTTICAVILMLGQSLIRFRLAEERSDNFFIYPFTLCAAIFAISFLIARYG